MTRPALPAALTAGRVVAIARRAAPGSLPGVAKALHAGGVHVLEVTLDSPGALDDLERLREGPWTVGAGT